MLKTIEEIIDYAREETKKAALLLDSDVFRMSVFSDVQMRYFVSKIIDLWISSNKELPSCLTKTAFLQRLTDAFINESLSTMRRSFESKQDLLCFADTISSEDAAVIKETTNEIKLSETDLDFLYNTYLVTELINNDLHTKNGYDNILSNEDFLMDVAKKVFEQTKHIWEKNNNSKIPSFKFDKNRKFMILLGPPGCGKTLLAKSLMVDGFIPIDVDNIALEIAKLKNINLHQFENEIYDEAANTALIVSRIAFEEGYNTIIEKIGHNEREIIDFTNNYKNLMVVSGYDPTALLTCIHLPKEVSVVRAANRTAQQIYDNNALRYYQSDKVYEKDNCSIFTYLELLKDHLQGSEEIFNKMYLRIMSNDKYDSIINMPCFDFDSKKYFETIKNSIKK